MQDIFTDRMVNLNIHQGIARIDFARLESIDTDKNQAKFQANLRLAMPLDAFMQMTEQFVKVREEMIKQIALQQQNTASQVETKH